MENEIEKSELYLRFRKDLLTSPLLDYEEEKLKSGELIPLSLYSFYDLFFRAKRFYFTSFYSAFPSYEDEGKFLLVGKRRLLKKETYAREEIQDLLVFSDKHPEKIYVSLDPVRLEKFYSSFEGKKIYLSLGDLYYKNKDRKVVSIAPILFCPVDVLKDENGYSFVLSSSTGILNSALFLLLKEQYGLSLFASGDEETDPEVLLEKVEKRIKGTGFALDPALHLTSLDADKDAKEFEFLVKAISLAPDPLYNAYKGRPVKENADGNVLGNYPLFVKDCIRSFFSHKIMRIPKFDEMNRFFVDRLIGEEMLRHRSVLILTENSEQKEKAKKLLSDRFYDFLMPYKNPDDPQSALFTVLEAKKKTPQETLSSDLLLRKERIGGNVRDQEEDDYILKNSELVTGEDPFSAYAKMYAAQKDARELFDFSDIDDYDFNDTLRDMDFLDFLSNTKFGRDVPFTHMAFYGLNSEVERNEYPSIMEFLRDFHSAVLNFQSAVSRSEIRSTGWSDYNSIKDFDETVKVFQVLAKYENFPLEYFSIDFTPEVVSDISELETCYRTRASIRLSFDVLCSPEVKNLDFRQVLKDITSRSKEKELKKKLRKIIKIPPFRKSYKTFIVFADKFVQNEERIETLQNELSPTFGTRMNSLDGLLYIDKCRSFIELYDRQKRLYDHLDFDNPFVKKLLNDHLFSESFRTVYFPQLLEIRSVLENSLDRFRHYFNEDKFDYSGASFSEILGRLDQKLYAKEGDFLTYLSFSKKADAGSKALREAVESVEKREGTLDHFVPDYTYSIYRFFFLKAVTNIDGVKQMETRSDDELNMYALLDEFKDLLSRDYLSEYPVYLSNQLTRPSYTQAVRKLKELYHSKRLVPVKSALRISGGVFFNCYPLLVEDFSTDLYLSDSKFDLVILYGEHEYRDADVTHALLLAKNALIIGGNPGNLLRSVPYLDLSLERDLHAYMRRRDYPSFFLPMLKKTFAEQGILLETDKDVAPGVLLPFYFETGGNKYALRIEDTSDRADFSYLYSAPSFLYLIYGIKTVSLYPLLFFVYPSLSVLSLYQKSELLKQENSGAPSSYLEEKKQDYFSELGKISSSFPPFGTDGEKDPSVLHSSVPGERPLSAVPEEEVENGILTYLSHFTYLNRDVLIHEIGRVLGTDEKDVDFRLLFTKAELRLLQENKIRKEENRLYLVRD